MTNLYLAADVADVSTEARTFTGVAVTYGEVTQDGRNVAFSAGAFGDLNSQSLTAVLLQHPFATGAKAVSVGRVESWEDKDGALHFTARLNDSEAGEAAYLALKAGEINSVSVGVYVSEFDEADELTTFTEASLLELSLITEGDPALAGSKILDVFNAQLTDEAAASDNHLSTESNQMENENTEVAELRSEVEEINRHVAVLAANNNSNSERAESRFHSMGQIVKAIAAGDEEAKSEYLAYTGGTSADTATERPGWARDTRKFVEGKRTILDLFRKEALPAEGMEVAYFVNGSDTVAVGQQVNEGDDLDYGKITLDQDSAPIKTYGGWVEWSAQQIERSPISVIEEGYRALARQYAQVTEGAIRTSFLGANGQAVTGFDASNYGKVIDTVIDGAVKLDDKGYAMEFIVVSPATFKALAKLEQSGKSVLDRDNGRLDISGVSGELFSVPLILLPSASGALFKMCNSDAITTWEDSGAPHRLQDSNIVNLTQQFSLYGWLASAVTAPNAIVSGTA